MRGVSFWRYVCRMSTPIIFAPSVRTVADFPAIASIADLAEERGVYSACPEFVRAHCGPIARNILELIPASYHEEADDLGLHVNIDVRIHRLYVGDIPAYPGWHADDEYRESYHAQPDLLKVPPHRHLVGTVSTEPVGVSNTRFLIEDFTAHIAEPSATETLWGQVHRQVERAHADSPLAMMDAPDGRLIEFGSFTLHRAMQATVRGWRLFFRASMWHKPYLGDGGMLSRQEQVYKIDEGSGW